MDTLAPSRHSTGPLAPSGTLQGSSLPVSERPAPSPTVAAASQLPYYWNDIDLLFRDPPKFLRRCQPELTRFWLRLGYHWPRNIMDRVEAATLDAVWASLRASSSKTTIDILALYFELMVPIIQDVDKGLSISPNTKHLARSAHNESTNYIEPLLRPKDVASVSSHTANVSRRPSSPSGASSHSADHSTVVPFKSIVKRSARRESDRLAPVNVTYRGSDGVMNWRASSSESSRGSQPSTLSRSRHSQKSGPGNGVESRFAHELKRDVSSPSDTDNLSERRPMYRSSNVVENFIHLGRNSGRGEGMGENEEDGERHLAVGQVEEMMSNERTTQWAKYQAVDRSGDEGAFYAPKIEAPARLDPRAALDAANVEDEGVVIRRCNELVPKAASGRIGGCNGVELSRMAAIAEEWFGGHPNISSKRAEKLQDTARQALEMSATLHRDLRGDDYDVANAFKLLLQALTGEYLRRRETRKSLKVEETDEVMDELPSSSPSPGIGENVEETGNVVHGVSTRHAEFVEPMLGSETKARATERRVDGKMVQPGGLAVAHHAPWSSAVGGRENSMHGATRHAGSAELAVGSKRRSEAIHTRVDGKDVEMGGKNRAHHREARLGRAERVTSALNTSGNELSRSQAENTVSTPWMAPTTPSPPYAKVHTPFKSIPACSKARENPSPRHAGLNFPRPYIIDPARSQGVAMVAAVAGHARVEVHPRGEGRKGERARGTSMTPLDGGGTETTKRSHVTSTRTHVTPADFLSDATGHDPVLLAAVRGVHPSGIRSLDADLLARIAADMDRGVYTSQLNTAVMRYCKSDMEADSLIDLVNHGARYRALEWFMDSGRWRPPLTARRIMSMSCQPRGYLPRLVDMVFDHMEVERAFIGNAQRTSTLSTVPVVTHFDDGSSVYLSDDNVAGNNFLVHGYESDARLVNASRSPNPSVVGGYDCSETRSASANIEYLVCMRQLVPCQTSDEESLGNGRLSKGTVDAPEILAYDVRTYRCEEECGDFCYYTEELDRVSVNSDDFVDEPISGSDYGSDQSSRSDQEEGGSSVDYYNTENEEGVYEVYEDADTQYEPDDGSNYHDSEPDEGSESSDFYSDSDGY